MYQRFFLFIIALFFIPIFTFAANSDVAISDVLFDPAGGTDTGLEYVVIKNYGASSVNLTGWDLYPDGAGYFTFPNFILEAGASVKINLRANGSDDASNLFFPSASGNMGNSSGSLALFSNIAHSKDTIISYVRYQKLGSSERKTWETAAASAGIWTAGTFVDISAGTEGKALKLTDFGNRASQSAWILEDAVAPAAGNEPQPTPQAEESSVYFSGSVAPRPINQIKAYAGPDRNAIAGAQMFFEGYAEGLAGEPLDGARFSWNFGDGFSLSDGKKTAHTFLYPGNYIVSLNVSSGEYSALDTAMVNVASNPLIISEVKTGSDGWIEIQNNSNSKIEISGFGLGAGNSKPFYFAENTYLAPRAFVAVTASSTGIVLPESGEIKLFYPNSAILLSSFYPSINLSKDESLSFFGDPKEAGWIKTKATPGVKNAIASTPVSNVVYKNSETKVSAGQEITPTNNGTEENLPDNINLTASTYNAGFYKFLSGEYFWLFAGLGAGIFVGLAYFLIRMYLTKS